MRSLFRFLLKLILVVLILGIGYALYVFLSYHRIDDNQVLSVVHNDNTEKVETGKPYSVLSFNIGFGAYEPDYGFFMDGGTQSWAWSKERLVTNLSNIGYFLYAADSEDDFFFIQELDAKSTRTYHVDEQAYIKDALNNKSSVFAINYDSPFLMYPVSLKPHGKSLSGIMTLSDFNITSSVRRSLPVEEGLMKYVDLDRCFTVSRVEVENGRELILINLHLSAYTSDGNITDQQLEMLLTVMKEEYEKGNYCIAGGDFNKDVTGMGAEGFGISGGEYNWAKKIDSALLESYNIRLADMYDENNPVPSCRNADGPYHPSQYQITLDGFLVTDNVEIISTEVLDTGFRYSDHNPVRMTFSLIP